MYIMHINFSFNNEKRFRFEALFAELIIFFDKIKILKILRVYEHLFLL